MGSSEIQTFISLFATQRKIAASTPNQALSAILFLYRNVLQQNVEVSSALICPKKPKRLPTVLAQSEAMEEIGKNYGVTHLMIKLLHGSGPRLFECMRLRFKDIDFENHHWSSKALSTDELPRWLSTDWLVLRPT